MPDRCTNSALEIRERVLGPEHPATADSLNDLAMVLQAQGDLVGAQPLCVRALTIREKVRGANHLETAHSLNNLAMLLHAQGDLTGARPLLERALAIKENVLRPDHPDTATTLDNLAALLQAEGDLAAARSLLERRRRSPRRSLAQVTPTRRRRWTIWRHCCRPRATSRAHRRSSNARWQSTKTCSGPDDPDTATTIDNLAGLLQAQGDLAGAQPLAERALAIYDRVFGPEHPDAARTLDNLAALMQAQGDLTGAAAL